MEYRVVPMHREVEHGVPVLGEALRSGLTAKRDPRRHDFYSTEIDGETYYFHVYDARKTAYLLSVELANGLAISPAEIRDTATGCIAC
jgi:hypothetical protein